MGTMQQVCRGVPYRRCCTVFSCCRRTERRIQVPDTFKVCTLLEVQARNKRILIEHVGLQPLSCLAHRALGACGQST